MTSRSPLGHARGLGSAKEGVQHWWVQRMTALALVPLVLWFVASIIGLAGASHAEVVAWIGRPLPAVLLLLLIAAGFHHSQLGLQVVIEDYVHDEGHKMVALIAVKAATIVVGALAALAVIRIAAGG
jgi:succinate dehydrogenase / fumarate reductase, membrane anchor subunit